LLYVGSKVQIIRDGLKFNGTHQFWSHFDYVSLLGENLNTTDKNREVLSGTIKEIVGIEYMQRQLLGLFV
jgi:hypothetical protein